MVSNDEHEIVPCLWQLEVPESKALSVSELKFTTDKLPSCQKTSTLIVNAHKAIELNIVK